jgi:hypothetical protein
MYSSVLPTPVASRIRAAGQVSPCGLPCFKYRATPLTSMLRLLLIKRWRQRAVAYYGAHDRAYVHTHEVVEVACYRHLARGPCRFRARA